MVAAFAEFERDRIAERISDVKSSEREKNRYLGGSKPFGFRVGDDGQLIPDQKEQLVIDNMRRLKNEGMSLRAIADTVSTGNMKISHVTVKRLLRDQESTNIL